jgi:hypothetical protein
MARVSFDLQAKAAELVEQLEQRAQSGSAGA